MSFTGKNFNTRPLIATLLAILLPIIFLSVGIYGTFLFTFSIPILWQVGIRGKPLSSLGLKRELLGSSLIAGLITGIIIGLLGGNLLRLFGISGYSLPDTDTLQFTIGPLNFSLQKEVSFRLLTASNIFTGGFLYFLFTIFVIGLGEELFWRGFIQSKISQRLTKNLAIWLTAALFATVHFYIFTIIPFRQGILFLSTIMVVGAIWGYLFNYFQNIWGAALSHGIVAFIIWKYYFFLVK